MKTDVTTQNIFWQSANNAIHEDNIINEVFRCFY